MNSVELDHLETQIDHLMQLLETVQFENATLRQKIAVHAQERARLQHRNQRAAKQVRQIIKNIKEELA